jgi:hypothetical protein
MTLHLSHSRHGSSREGWVYVLSNPSLPGMHKIGRTTGAVEVRANDLHTTGVPTPFKVEFAMYVEDCADLEQWVHRLLAIDRVASSREFFHTSLPDVVAALQLGAEDKGMVRDLVKDPNALLPETRERRRREAVAKAAAELERVRGEAKAREEADRRGRIEAEVEAEIKVASSKVGWRWLYLGPLIVVASVVPLAMLYGIVVVGVLVDWKAGIVVAGAMLWALLAWCRAMMRLGERRWEARHAPLRREAEAAIAAGSASLKAYRLGDKAPTPESLATTPKA